MACSAVFTKSLLIENSSSEFGKLSTQLLKLCNALSALLSFHDQKICQFNDDLFLRPATSKSVELGKLNLFWALRDSLGSILLENT